MDGLDASLGIGAIVFVLCAIALAGAFLFFGSFDSSVVKQCAKHGYWQTGQTRVLCSVERP